MKKLILNTVLAFCLSTYAVAGNEGHAGDAYVAEFIFTGRSIHKWISSHQTEVKPAEFIQALERANIESTDQILYLNGKQVDAINYPSQQRIIFSREAFRRFTEERQRWALVLHEVLSLEGVEDARFQVSGPVVTTAFASPNLQAREYSGTIPTCLKYFEFKPSKNAHEDSKRTESVAIAISLEPEQRETESVTTYRSVYSVINKGELGILEHLAVNKNLGSLVTRQFILSKGLKCEYSTYHAGLMECTNKEHKFSNQKEEFSIRKKIVVTYDSYEQPTMVQWNINIGSFALTDELKKIGYQTVSGHHPVATPVTQDEFTGISTGKFPVIMSELSWTMGNWIQKLGIKYFEDARGISRLQVPAMQCFYPKDKSVLGTKSP